MKKLLLSTLFCSTVVFAQQAGVTTHTKADLDHVFAELMEAAPKNPIGSATRIIDDHGVSRTLLAARIKSGESELHENWADEFVVNSGSITVVVGGEMTGKHMTEPGEYRGTGLIGDVKKYTLKPGDILHIPMGIPHWTTLEPGTKATYIAFKEK